MQVMARLLGEAEMDLAPAPLGMEHGAAPGARRRQQGRRISVSSPCWLERAGDASRR
jgi:hypothetical protein